VTKNAGALTAKVRVLDSTALYDSVATQDTVTQLRSAIRNVLATVTRTWRFASGRCSPETTTTPPRASRRATGTTPWLYALQSLRLRAHAAFD
jgi:hypothetical protein